MATRGAYGFRIEGTDKVTYNHSFSCPCGLGREVLRYVADTPLEEMKEAASRIVLVSELSTPSPYLIEEYKQFADLNVAGHSLEDWYCLLRKAQGNLSAYNNGLEHMIDSREFLFDSLHCEWAYIINLDAAKLEVFRGLNKVSSAPGRYAAKSGKGALGFCGVSLISEKALDEIREDKIDELIADIKEAGRAIKTG